MNYCGWAGCGIPLVYNGRGRPPKYCPEHAAESKRRADNARPDYGRIRKRYSQCCLDAKAAGVRTSGTKTIRVHNCWNHYLGKFYTRVARVGSAHIKSANVRTCEQHRQWQTYYTLSRKRDLARQSEARAEKNDSELVEIKESGRFRLTMGNPDDYYVPDPRMVIEQPSPGLGWFGIPIPAVKSGYDVEIERKTRDFLREKNTI